jgi:hypothetical protein
VYALTKINSIEQASAGEAAVFEVWTRLFYQVVGLVGRGGGVGSRRQGR